MRSKKNILVVDDEQPTIDSLTLLLGDDFNLWIARSGEEALQIISSQSPDLVFLDITLQGIDGFEVLKEIKRHDDSIEVVMLTADEKAKTAIRAIDLGAFSYITKPYDKDDILLATRRVFEKKHMTEEIISLKDEVEQRDSFHSMVGQDPKMRELYKIITKLAQTDSTVLITGESGTGKELVAKAIHDQSRRRGRHFKAINCGAIPEHLLESELFGHEKGSFTGAVERKIGKFEMANGGTLFLDEISSMKEPLQVKLLRVLQEREIERVGGIKAIPIDARILAATNLNLRKLTDSGQFREDLFYRLNVIHIHVPALRERPEDIPLLAEHFLSYFAKKFNKNIEGFTREAQQILKEYPWPGNVRELKNVIERALVLLDRNDLIGKEHLPLDLSIPRDSEFTENSSFSLRAVLDAYERRVILNILERTGWNQTRASEILGIHRNTLLVKLDALGINVKRLKEESESKVLA
jgi:two-component system response regulator AtoC